MDKQLRRAVLLVEEFRKINPEMQMQQALAFLLVAKAGDEGLPMKKLEEELGVASSSASRNVAVLSKVHWRGPDVPGYGLVDRIEDPYDRRNKLVKLTAQGRRVLASIISTMEK